MAFYIGMINVKLEEYLLEKIRVPIYLSDYGWCIQMCEVFVQHSMGQLPTLHQLLLVHS